MEYSKKCEQCDKVFYKKSSTSKKVWPTVKFCSKACASHSFMSKGSRSKKCEKCNVEFSRPKDSADRDWNNRKYCSKKCADECKAGGNSGSFKKGHSRTGKGENHQNWVAVMPKKNCALCGIEFSKPRAEALVRWKKRQYCSKSCSGTVNAALAPKGDRHPSWRGGMVSLQVKIRRMYLYRKWRKMVLLRDEATCVVCEGKQNIEVDHLYPFSRLLFENDIKTTDDARVCESLWKIENGRTLCTTCHMKTDTYGVKSSQVMRTLHYKQ